MGGHLVLEEGHFASDGLLRDIHQHGIELSGFDAHILVVLTHHSVERWFGTKLYIIPRLALEDRMDLGS
jgi:hypothetical protein